MWAPIITYNFTNIPSAATSWSHLFGTQRRDANFAAVFKLSDDSFVAIRDHLGTVPLYYRTEKNKDIKWAFSYTDLVKPGDKIQPEKIRDYLGIASPKVVDLIPEIKLVPPGTVLQVTHDNVKTLFQYKIPVHVNNGTYEELKTELSKLLEKAVERTIKSDTVGLYLSGGMDSGLVGLLLKKKGIKVNCYTALPWGKESSEFKYAQMNHSIIKADNHEYVDVLPSQYDDLFRLIPHIYRTPHGTATSVNIAALWKNTKIAQEEQLFFAQNTDTLAASVPAQVNTLVMSYFPHWLRNVIVDMPRYDLIENYLYHATRGAFYTHEYTALCDHPSPISKVALAGMYIGHTPSDSEVINAPSININQLCSNPYYDMDVIEFYLGVPAIHKIALNKNQKTIISIEKKLFRAVACDVLPKDLVYRKKGFTLPQNRSKDAYDYFGQLTNSYNGITPGSHYEKISLHLLMKYWESFI